MIKEYLTSSDSGHYFLIYEDGEILDCYAGADVACIRNQSFLLRFEEENKGYKLMNEEEFKEWETKALIMRELTEIENHEPKY